jgi:hypothetical protein
MEERERSISARMLRAALITACLWQPPEAHSAAQLSSIVDGQRVIEGPFYSPRKLRAFQIFGVHLSMPATEAVAALAAAGLVRQDTIGPQMVDTSSEILGNFNLPQSAGWVQLHYTKVTGHEAVISSINYWRRLPGDEGNAAEKLRAELIAAYGDPTVWTQKLDERGALRDSALYVPARRFADSSVRKMVQACGLNWVCTELQNKVDCRDLLKSSDTPFVEIHFAPQAVIYQLSDYAPVYGALARDARFRGEEPIEAACPAPSAE